MKAPKQKLALQKKRYFIQNIHSFRIKQGFLMREANEDHYKILIIFSTLMAIKNALYILLNRCVYGG